MGDLPDKAINDLDRAASQGVWGDNLVPPIKQGDARVRLGVMGRPPDVPIRILSEENWQLAAALVNAYRAGELVKRDVTPAQAAQVRGQLIRRAKA